MLVPGIVEEMSILCLGYAVRELSMAIKEYFLEFIEISRNAKEIDSECYEKLAKFISLSPYSVSHGKRKRADSLKTKVLNELSSIDSFDGFDFVAAAADNEAEDEDVWGPIFKFHLSVLKLSSQEDFSRAVEEQINLINSLLRIFSSSSQLVLLYAVADDLWKLALKSENSSESQEQAARAINRLFIACITERKAVISVDSRKWGTFKFASLLLRIYFHLGQLNLVQNVLKALQACELPPVDRFPRAHTVTFNFFLGRYHFGREEFEQAEECFFFCYERLSLTDHLKHLNCILHFMIPVKLILHLQRPSPELISMFSNSQNRLFYTDFCRFVATGDLKGYKELMDLNCNFMLKFGTFSIYEKMVLFLLRQRILHIHRMNDNCTRIPLSSILSTEKGVEADSIACLVANIIAKGLIRGYISEEKQFLVLSAQNPFPKALPPAILCDK